MKEEKRSPIKDPPTRLPGQSLDEEYNKLLYEEIASYMVASACAVLLAFWEWYRWYTDTPPQPLMFALLAVSVIAFSVARCIPHVQRARNYRRGSLGEKAVGQLLERMRAEGYEVFHDVPSQASNGAACNIDHVLVGPAGIFTIETKTRFKPVGRRADIIYDGECVEVDGYKPDRDPVAQARAEAHWLRNMLRENTGGDFPIKPVVVFPGWFVRGDQAGVEVWVLNENSLPKFIGNEPVRLQDNEIRLAGSCIKRHVQDAKPA